MRLRQLLQESFSPYEIAIMGRAMTFATGIVAMAALFPHPARIAGFAFGIGMIFLLLTLIIGLMWEEFSLCPTCGKSPLKRAKGDLNWYQLYVLKYRYRFWPERQCSECGTALDIRP